MKSVLYAKKAFLENHKCMCNINEAKMPLLIVVHMNY